MASIYQGDQMPEENMSGDRRDWTADEIVLTIWAHHEIAKNPANEARVLQELAAELRCSVKKVAAAVEAVDTPALSSQMLDLLTGRAAPKKNLLADPSLARKEATKIRRNWMRPRP